MASILGTKYCMRGAHVCGQGSRIGQKFLVGVGGECVKRFWIDSQKLSKDVPQWPALKKRLLISWSILVHQEHYVNINACEERDQSVTVLVSAQ